MQKILDLLNLYGQAFGNEMLRLTIYDDYSGYVSHSAGLREIIVFDFYGEKELLAKLKDGIKHEAAY